MRYYFLVIIILIFSSSNTYASSWAKIFSSSDSSHNVAYSIQQTTDGGFIIAGYTFIVQPLSAWVLKLDSNGNIQWQKAYNGGGMDYFLRAIRQTTDGGYIAAGFTVGWLTGIPHKFLILKLNSNGNIQWQKTYGGGGDLATSIQQTSDGGYIVGGEGNSFGGGWLLKLDGGGNIQWQKGYIGGYVGEEQSIQQTTDGGYIVAGYTKLFGAGADDAWILKLDSNGNVQWQKTYGGILDEEAYSIQRTTDGGYIVGGYTQSFGVSSSTAWILKLDSNGNIQWQKFYGGSNNEMLPYIKQTVDGGFVAAGSILLGDYGYACISKLDSSGNIQWQKTYGGNQYNYLSQNNYLTSVGQTTDGGYFASGASTSFNPARTDDIFVLKLDSNGEIPYCSIMNTINVTAHDTNATVSNSGITAMDTNVSPQTLSLSVSDTTAIVTTPCYSCYPTCTVTFPNGATVTYSNVDSACNTTFTEISNPRHNPPPNFNFIRYGYFDISTDCNYTGPITVVYPYDESQIRGQEQNLKLFHWKDNGWEDCTVSVNTSANTITG